MNVETSKTIHRLSLDISTPIDSDETGLMNDQALRGRIATCWSVYRFGSLQNQFLLFILGDNRKKEKTANRSPCWLTLRQDKTGAMSLFSRSRTGLFPWTCLFIVTGIDHLRKGREHPFARFAKFRHGDWRRSRSNESDGLFNGLGPKPRSAAAYDATHRLYRKSGPGGRCIGRPRRGQVTNQEQASAWIAVTR
jgi:hypothetical protein